MNKGLFSIVSIALLFLFSLGCKRAPEYFVAGDSGQWKIIELNETTTDKQKWQTVVDIVATKLDIETLDETSGYIRTGWKIGYGFTPGDSTYNIYRVRATIKFEPGFKRIRIKTEAIYNNVTGFDNRLLNDIVQDIQGRLGRTVK